MPQRKFSLINARNIQTTPNVAFRQEKMQPNPGIYPNPLIGWRKQIERCDCSSNIRWYQVFKNTCCKPPIRRIQNRNGIMSRRDVSGGAYNYTTQGYLQSRCRTYNQNAFNFDISYNNNTSDPPLHPLCCTDCSSSSPVIHNNSIYKRNNPQFRKQGAVSSRARLNRLKYNTIVSTMPVNKIYWGGQSANKTVWDTKSKNKCFCGPTRFAPCRGQNQPCGNWPPILHTVDVATPVETKKADPDPEPKEEKPPPKEEEKPPPKEEGKPRK